jgi:hypothetical protein
MGAFFSEQYSKLQAEAFIYLPAVDTDFNAEN